VNIPLLIAAIVLGLTALVVYLLLVSGIIGPVAEARRKRATRGPTPDTDGEPDQII
jgi:hypothetical protein